jgi:hypothetical protein
MQAQVRQDSMLHGFFVIVRQLEQGLSPPCFYQKGVRPFPAWALYRLRKIDN